MLELADLPLSGEESESDSESDGGGRTRAYQKKQGKKRVRSDEEKDGFYTTN